MKKILEHPIISAVLASLILSFLGWLSGVLPIVVSWLKSIFIAIYDFATYEITIHLWLLFVLCIPITIWLGQILKPILNKTNKTANNNAPVTYEYDEPGTEEITLSTEQISVLKVLVQKDGASADFDDFKYQLDITKLQAQQILESLLEYELVRVTDNWMHGPQFNLTNQGRDFMLGNKYAQS